MQNRTKKLIRVIEVYDVEENNPVETGKRKEHAKHVFKGTTCYVCGKSTKKPMRHMKTFHSKEYKNQISAQAAKRPITTQIGDKMNEKMYCTTCGASVKGQKGLRVHTLWAHTERGREIAAKKVAAMNKARGIA